MNQESFGSRHRAGPVGLALLAMVAAACGPAAGERSGPAAPTAGASQATRLPTPGTDLNPKRAPGGEVLQTADLHVRGLAQRVYFGNPRFFGEVVNATGRRVGARIFGKFWKNGLLVQDRSAGPLGYIELEPGAAAAFDILLPGEGWDRYEVTAEATPADQFARLPGLAVSTQDLARVPSGELELTGTVKNDGSTPAQRLVLVMTALDSDGTVVCAATIYAATENVAPGGAARFETRIPTYCEWDEVARYDLAAFSSTSGR